MALEQETVWRALSSPHRRKLLELMREGPKTTGELSRELPDLSRFAVMQHLGVLEEAHLILPRREGRRRFNHLNPAPIREIYERWMNPHASIAAETAQQLKRYAERAQADWQPPASDKEAPQMGNDVQFRLVKVEMEMRINAPREKVFEALTIGYNDWWPHRYKADSRVDYEARVGGLIQEVFAEGGGALYGEIVYIDPQSKIISSGPSSLLRGFSSYNVEMLEDVEDGTLYSKSMSLWGDVPEEMETMFREGSRVVVETALKGYVEQGIKYSKEGR